jgi:RNA polymerase sigma factor (sigma-70 family)
MLRSNMSAIGWQSLYDSTSVQQSVRSRIRRILQRSPGRNTNIEDACQEAWTRLWQLGERYWNPRGVNFVSRCVAIDYLRKDQTHHAASFLPLHAEARDSDEEMSSERETLARNERTFEAVAAQEIKSKVSMLPAQQRAVFSFCYSVNGHEELTFAQIAVRLGISESETVKVFCQARRNIRALLGEKNG